MVGEPETRTDIDTLDAIQRIIPRFTMRHYREIFNKFPDRMRMICEMPTALRSLFIRAVFRVFDDDAWKQVNAHKNVTHTLYFGREEMVFLKDANGNFTTNPPTPDYGSWKSEEKEITPARRAVLDKLKTILEKKKKFDAWLKKEIVLDDAIQNADGLSLQLSTRIKETMDKLLKEDHGKNEEADPSSDPVQYFWDRQSRDPGFPDADKSRKDAFLMICTTKNVAEEFWACWCFADLTAIQVRFASVLYPLTMPSDEQKKPFANFIPYSENGDHGLHRLIPIIRFFRNSFYGPCFASANLNIQESKRGAESLGFVFSFTNCTKEGFVDKWNYKKVHIKHNMTENKAATATDAATTTGRGRRQRNTAANENAVSSAATDAQLTLMSGQAVTAIDKAQNDAAFTAQRAPKDVTDTERGTLYQDTFLALLKKDFRFYAFATQLGEKQQIKLAELEFPQTIQSFEAIPNLLLFSSLTLADGIERYTEEDASLPTPSRDLMGTQHQTQQDEDEDEDGAKKKKVKKESKKLKK